MLSMLLGFWASCGLRLSWRKGEFGDRARWIGSTLTVERPHTLVLGVPGDFIAKILEDIGPEDNSRAMPAKVLRRVAARVGWAAGVARVLGSFAARKPRSRTSGGPGAAAQR